MASVRDAVRERLAAPSDPRTPHMVLIERDYLVTLLLAHADRGERFGALELDATGYMAKYAGRTLDLTKDMFLTLYAIASKPCGATYREIYDLCKCKGFIAGCNGRFETNVRTMIKRLRKKLVQAGLPARLIVNRPGIGYRWHDPSSRAESRDAKSDELSLAEPLAS